MAETFATTFGPGSSSTGLLTNLPLLGPQYTGTGLLSGAEQITVTGNVNLPGDTVTVNTNLLNLTGVDLTGTYAGFTQASPGAEPIYYFNVTGGSLVTPLSIAVTGGTIPALNVANSVNIDPNTPAPDSPTIVCFVTGTKIRTDRGEVAVEELQVGDFAVTASGTLRPITWIGHREIAPQAGSVSFNQQPVRVRAGAFGHGLPIRDLLLSPGHPVLVGDADNEGGVLVPAMCLINGTSITREQSASVTYWHVELDSHDILLAEGLPAESYIDGGDRAFFTEASDHALHNPDFVAPGWNGRCRPVAVDGPFVEAERVRLDAVFAGSLNAPCAWDAAERNEWLAA